MKGKPSPSWWALAVPLALLLVLYLSWQGLLRQGVQRWLASQGWELQSWQQPGFSIGLLSLDELQLRRAGAGGAELVVELEQLQAGFSWQRLSLDRVDVGRMRVHWQQGSSREPLPWPELPQLRLPVTEVQVAQLELDLKLAGGQRWQQATPIKFNQTAPGQYEMQFTLLDQPGSLRTQTGMPSSMELRWPAALDSHSSTLYVTYAKKSSKQSDNEYKVKLAGNLALKKIPEQVKEIWFSKKSSVTGELGLELEVELGPHLGEWSRMSGAVDARELTLDLNDDSNTRLKLQGKGSLQLENPLKQSPWSIRLEPGLALSLESSPGRRVQAMVKLQQAYRLTSGSSQGLLPVQLQVDGSDPLQFQFSELKLAQPKHGQDLNASGKLKLPPSRLQSGWPETGIDASWQWTAGQLRASGKVISRDQRRLLDWRVEYHQPTACADFELDHSGTLSQFNEWLSLAPAPVREFNLQAGSSSGHLTGRYCPGRDVTPKATGWFQIEQGRLGWSKSALSDLKLRLELEDLRSRQGKLSLQAAQLSLGAPLQLSESRLELAAMRDSLELRHFSAGMLGGVLMAEPSRLSMPLKSGAMALQIEGLELEQLLRLIDLPGLQGSGRLSGRLPLSWEERGAEIKDGQLQSSGEGRISYQSAIPVGDNIGLQALRDFRYQRLGAGLDYHADGRYRLRLRLEGHNPELYQGHPIDFNMVINGELPGLLQGALLSGDFNTYLLKQLQQGKLE